MTRCEENPSKIGVFSTSGMQIWDEFWELEKKNVFIFHGSYL